MRIYHNLVSTNAHKNLKVTDRRYQKTMEKLASGKRINRAADDAAGLSISQKMLAQTTGLQQARRNINDGISLIQTAEGGLQEVHNMLQRMRELCVEASNDTLSNYDRQQINEEIQQLQEGINSIATDTEFNGMKILNSEGLVVQKTEIIATTTMVPTVTLTNQDFLIPDVTALTPEQQNLVEADLVFVVDHTGSMGDNIQNVIDNLDKFIGHFQGTDVQIGLVTYSDDNIVTHDLGLTQSDFKQTLQNLPLIGGFEYALDALKDHATTLSYRPTAQKHMILLTDEIADSKNGYDINTVATELDNDGYIVDVIAPTSNPGGINTLATTTGGDTFDIYNPYFRSNMYGILTNIVSEATGIPEGSLPTKTVTEEVEQITYTAQPSQEVRIVQSVEPLHLQVGANNNQTLDIQLCDTRTQTIGVHDVSAATQETAVSSLSKIDAAINVVSDYRSRFGSYQNRLDHIQTSVSNAEINLTAAHSRIEDADLAKEMIQLTKNQIFQQAGQSMLVQGNLLPQNILKLIS